MFTSYCIVEWQDIQMYGRVFAIANESTLVVLDYTRSLIGPILSYRSTITRLRSRWRSLIKGFFSFLVSDVHHLPDVSSNL